MNNEAMNNDSGVEEKDRQGGRLKRRLKGVRKRRRAHRFDLKCEAVALKMRLVKTEEGSEH
ncbi:MAG: hypothetical protein V3S14_00285 [Anaerolineae bacterium]